MQLISANKYFSYRLIWWLQGNSWFCTADLSPFSWMARKWEERCDREIIKENKCSKFLHRECSHQRCRKFTTRCFQYQDFFFIACLTIMVVFGKGLEMLLGKFPEVTWATHWEVQARWEGFPGKRASLSNRKTVWFLTKACTSGCDPGGTLQVKSMVPTLILTESRRESQKHRGRGFNIQKGWGKLWFNSSAWF